MLHGIHFKNIKHPVYYSNMYFPGGANINIYFPGGLAVKNLPARAGDTWDSGSTPGPEDPLE